MRALLALLVALAAVCSPVNVEVEKVRRWVARQGLRDYRDRVVSLGVETMFDLPLLQQEDLESTGMSKLQVRKFIKEASNLPKRTWKEAMRPLCCRWPKKNERTRARGGG